ncbi:hypothetical protein [Paraburkholderia sp.]|uniref:hypothetical protein n=1 Tax=Paraburkholderia sp. TaxID=1926495 RepID=UPI0025D2A80E|nr:hypothetical protein [Paraburkholderia sp.]
MKQLFSTVKSRIMLVIAVSTVGTLVQKDGRGYYLGGVANSEARAHPRPPATFLLS